MKRLIFPLIASFVMSILFIVSCDKTVSVSSVKLDKDSITLGIGGTEMLIATVLPEKATNKTVLFTSNNPIVATVLPNGLVTGITKGEATIVVTTADGNYTASCQVKVEDISVTDVKLNKSKLILDIDETEELIASVMPENATNKAVYWTISNPAVATVVNGMVYPLSLGSAIITVTTLDGNKTAKCDLEIVHKVSVTGVELNKTTLNLGVGETEKLIAIVLPTNASNKNVTWNSNNASVASVDGNGLITANSDGTAIITVTTDEGSFKATCEVKCVSFTPPALTTLEPTDIVDVPMTPHATAKVGGNITEVGNPSYFERGIVFSVSPADPMNPSSIINEVKISGSGLGVFSQTVQFDMLYYNDYNIRAYVKTELGTTYGNMVTLTCPWGK
jgi:uncharacterized protein YjdB